MGRMFKKENYSWHSVDKRPGKISQIVFYPYVVVPKHGDGVGISAATIFVRFFFYLLRP